MMLSMQSNRQHRRQIIWVILSFVLITFYQNCENTMQTQGQASSSSTNAGASVVTPPSTGGGTVPPTMVNNCKPFLGTPSFTAQTLTDVTLGSGAGASTGDLNASQVTLTINNGITNQTQANALLCSYATNATCSFVSDDPTRKPVLLKAVALSGVDVAPSLVTDLDKANIFKMSLNMMNNNCSGAVNASSQKVVTISNMRGGATENYRCVQGTAWLKITAQTQLDNANKSAVSAPAYIKVNFQNNCWDESRLKQTGLDLQQLIGYGTASAVNGNWAAVVAPKENFSSSVLNVGSVYMFNKQGTAWIFSQKIMIADATAGDTLTAVAIRGSKLVITSAKRGNHGAAFLYNFNGTSWIQSVTLNPPLNQDNQYFGASLVMSDSYLAIGAPEYSITGAANRDRAGAVYIYTCGPSSCAYRNAILSPEVSRGFGSSLSLDVSNLAIGAPQAITQEAGGKGFVSIYDVSSSAVLLKRIDPTDGALGMRFGDSVALLGTKLAVGAPLKSTTTNAEAGSIYYYANYSVAPTRTIDGGMANGNLGQSVAFNSMGLFTGCPFCNSRAGLVNYHSFTKLNSSSAVDYQIFGLNQADRKSVV